MANSTFSGPVRSQNGFQELVNGVWTPVGSGGGGGSGTMINIDSVTDAENVVLDTPTEIGQTYTISVGWGAVPGGGVTMEVVLAALPEGATGAAFTGRIVDGSTGGSFVVLGEDSFTYNFQGAAACALITIVYAGIGGTEGGTYARFTVSGMALNYSG